MIKHVEALLHGIASLWAIKKTYKLYHHIIQSLYILLFSAIFIIWWWHFCGRNNLIIFSYTFKCKLQQQLSWDIVIISIFKFFWQLAYKIFCSSLLSRSHMLDDERNLLHLHLKDKKSYDRPIFHFVSPSILIASFPLTSRWPFTFLILIFVFSFMILRNAFISDLETVYESVKLLVAIISFSFTAIPHCKA